MRGVLDKDLVQMDMGRVGYKKYESCCHSKSEIAFNYARSSWRWIIRPSEIECLNSMGFTMVHPHVLILGME